MIKSRETQLFLEKFFRFNKLVHHKISCMTECPQSEYKMLGVIQREVDRQKKQQMDLPGVPVSQLSKVLLHSKPATSRILRTLEEKGYISRIPSKTDRRTVYIALTETGLQQNRQIMEHMDGYMNQILEKLGTEDTAELLRLMDRLYDVVAELAQKKNSEEEINKED